jgi:hypothetical protein
MAGNRRNGGHLLDVIAVAVVGALLVFKHQVLLLLAGLC